MKSLVLITAQPDTGNLVSTALGHQDPGAATYIVPLSATGLGPATHYGCQTWAADAFAGAIAACASQTALPPAPWAAVGLDEAAVYAFCGALIWDAREGGDAREHFAQVLAAHGLAQVRDAE